MSAWGYTVNCRAEVSSNNLEPQNAKKLKRDTCARSVEQECGSSWPLSLRVAEFEDSFQPPRFNYLVDDQGFLDDDADASVVSSSYPFSLPDVGAGMELFEQHAPAPVKQMDESWDAIDSLNNLDDDMDDIFGNNSFVQPDSVEVPSASSSPDSAVTRRVASSSCCPSSPDEKQAGVNISPVLAPQNCVNKPVYWVAQQQPETTLPEYQPSIILPGGPGAGPGGLFSDTASLESCAPPPPPPQQQQQQLLQGSMGAYKAFGGLGPRQEFDPKPVSGGGLRASQAVVYTHSPAQRRATNNPASTSGSESTLEAAVLYELGTTMSKLDVGTRLSIRNALYRLAKGACSRIGDGEESTSSRHRQAKPPASMACLEAGTNKFDRTVAGLLFYRRDSQQAPLTPDSVSPHSAISSSNNSWPAADQTGSTSDHPVMVCGSKPLPLPPVYNHSGYLELLSGKRGRRKQGTA